MHDGTPPAGWRSKKAPGIDSRGVRPHRVEKLPRDIGQKRLEHVGPCRTRMDEHDTGSRDRESVDCAGVTTGAPTGGCSCCDGVDADFEYYTSRIRLESRSQLIDPDDGTPVPEVELPEELQEGLGRFLDGSAVRTLGDWIAEVRERTGGGSIAVEDLCHERAETDHWGDIDGDRYHFTCFFDAVVLAGLTSERVDIRTESPDGTEIEVTVTDDGTLTVDPPGTLVSFGVVTAPAAIPDGEPTVEDVYAAVCPVVKAFPGPRTYERWARSVPAATVAMPLGDSTALATALVE